MKEMFFNKGSDVMTPEKKEWEKEKQRRKQEFFANRKQKPDRARSIKYSY